MKTFVLLLVLSSCTSFSVAQSSSQTSANPSYAEVFETVWKTVNENFFDPQFAGMDWNAVGEKYRPQLTRIKSDAEFHQLVSRMLKELPVSHLEFSLPRREGSAGLGIRTHSIDGRAVVTTVLPASDAQRAGLRIGDIIINPDEERGTVGTTANLRVRGCDGRERRVAVRREVQGQPERPSIRWRSFTNAAADRIGYIRAVRFDDDVAPLVDAAMTELKDTKALIIDVRDNTGGNMSFVRLSSYLAEGEHLVAALLTRYYLETKGTTPKQIAPDSLPKAARTYTDELIFNAMRSNAGAVAIYSEDLGEERYRGKAVVLINEETGSAAEGFAWHVRLKTNATLVGRKTAGALLGAEYYTLPGGWRLSVPTHSGWGPDGKPVIDEPVVPHIETKWTVGNVCSGTDPDVAKALEVLSSK